MSQRHRTPRRPHRWSPAAVVGVLAGLVLTGCGGAQSALNTAGPSAKRLATLWWGLLGIAVVVWLVVVFCVVWAVVLRRGDRVRPRRGGDRVVVIAGIVVPALILTGVFGWGVSVMRAEASPPTRPALSITVVGHDWWWEVRYPGFTTANEIHIPVGQSVLVNLRTADVIHSFWVPPLTKKTDLIPNKDNSTWLLASRPGTFHGQCAEFCGVEHAGMSFLVVAQPPGQFQTWLADQSRPAPAPSAGLAAHGEQVLTQQSCASCHTVRGTSAQGKVGPDLTHFGSRQELGAGVAPNNPGWLSGWIANSQTVKPGNLMPPQPLAPEDLQAVTAYLEELR